VSSIRGRYSIVPSTNCTSPDTDKTRDLEKHQEKRPSLQPPLLSFHELNIQKQSTSSASTTGLETNPLVARQTQNLFRDLKPKYSSLKHPFSPLHGMMRRETWTRQLHETCPRSWSFDILHVLHVLHVLHGGLCSGYILFPTTGWYFLHWTLNLPLSCLLHRKCLFCGKRCNMWYSIGWL